MLSLKDIEKLWVEYCQKNVFTCVICNECGDSYAGTCRCAFERFKQKMQNQQEQKNTGNPDSKKRYSF